MTSNNGDDDEEEEGGVSRATVYPFEDANNILLKNIAGEDEDADDDRINMLLGCVTREEHEAEETEANAFREWRSRLNPSPPPIPEDPMNEDNVIDLRLDDNDAFMNENLDGKKKYRLPDDDTWCPSPPRMPTRRKTPSVIDPLLDNSPTTLEMMPMESDPNILGGGIECLQVDVSHHFMTDQVFEGKVEVLEWVARIGKETHTIIVSDRSIDAKGNHAPRLYLRCERGGSYARKGAELHKRNTGTKKCGCPFQLVTKWKREAERGARFRREAHKCGKAIVKEMSKRGERPKSIKRALLLNDPDNVTTSTQIYNERISIKCNEMDGLTQMQHLLSELSEKGYVYEILRDTRSQEVRQLLFTHRDSLHLSKVNPHVFIMDCTYKTNMYNWKFLEIGGVTSTMKTFVACQVLMEREREVDYRWALQKFRDLIHPLLPVLFVTDRDLALMAALDEVFPEVNKQLCRWHIFQCVVSKGRELRMDDKWLDSLGKAWYYIVNAKTEEQFKLRVRWLRHLLERWPPLMAYIQSTWFPLRQKFVAFWVNQHYHFGQCTTNRAESLHARLKETLVGKSTYDFLGMWLEIHPMIEHEIREIRASLEYNTTKILHHHKSVLFNEIRGLVSHACMNLILTELKSMYRMIEKHDPTCYHRVRHTHGIPCACELATYHVEHVPIPADKVHPFWGKLDIEAKSTVVDKSLEIDPALELFMEKFKKSSEDQQRKMIRSINELSDPKTSSLKPPEVPAKAKGRPQGSRIVHPDIMGQPPTSIDTPPHNPSSTPSPPQNDTPTDSNTFHTPKPSVRIPKGPRSDPNSNRRQRSHWEKKGRQVSRISRGKDYAPQMQKSLFQPRERVRIQQSPYFVYFPPAVWEYIIDYEDSVPDGNCGFRSLCLCLGMLEDQWPWLRVQLVEELLNNIEVYSRLFDPDAPRKLTNLLTHSRGACGREHWMTLPSCAFLFAQRFECIVVYLGNTMCWTCLPSASKAKTAGSYVLCIGFVNGNHYIKLVLQDGCPLPPVPRQYALNVAKEVSESWLSLIDERVKAWEKLKIPSLWHSASAGDNIYVVEYLRE